MLSKINVTDEQLKILLQYKNETLALKSEIHADIMPLLADGIRQIRELTQTLILVSGAIAAFTIPVLSEDIIQIKQLAYYSLLLLFSAIVYGVYHLSEIIPKEVNALAKQHSTYNDLADESLARIYEVIETGDKNKLIDFDKNEVLNKLADLKEKPEPDRSLNIMRFLLITALLSLILSFSPVTLWISLVNLLSIENHMQTLNTVVSRLDFINAVLGGIVGLGLVFIVEYIKKPKINFGGFKKVETNFGTLYKVILSIKGLDSPGLTQLIIKSKTKTIAAKWAENPNPLKGDVLDEFVPEMVPQTSSLVTYPNKTYEVPIIHKDSQGDLTIFSGWWFGRNKGYGNDPSISLNDTIWVEVVSQGVNKTSKKHTVEEIISEASV